MFPASTADGGDLVKDLEKDEICFVADSNFLSRLNERPHENSK